ncbi:hypothetical protein CQ056_01625, partial [Peribacillus simplex]
PLQALAFRGRAGASSARLQGLPSHAFPAGVSYLPFQSTLCFKRKNCWLVLFRTHLRLVYPSCFFPVLLNGWKKCATLLPNNWLAETPQTLASRRLGRQSAERERVSEINWSF